MQPENQKENNIKMPVKKGQIHEVRVEDIAFGGKGFAKIEGLAVFIEGGVPGDLVNIRIVKKKKNHAEARVVELIAPSPSRIEPKCKYSGFCGGCKWQFLDYEKQLKFKQQHVAEALEHIALVQGTPVFETIPSKPFFGYRNKMEFSCSDRRWLMPHELGSEQDIGFALGLHVPGTFYKVLDNDYCLLHPDLGNDLLSEARRYIKESGIPVYGLRSQQGFWRFLMLRHSFDRDQWMINIITSSENKKAVQPLADLLMEKYPNVVSVMNNITSRKSSVAIGEYEINLAGESHITDKIGDYEFDISANSFFQTNTRGAEKLYAVAKQYADLKGSENVLDLYCGAGTISIYLSAQAATVTGIELSESAIADAEKNCVGNTIENCRFISGDVKEKLAHVSSKPDVIIIDPPRTGMHKSVLNQVVEILPPKIVYVSCNPATMARDLLVLKEHYHIEKVQPVDMFPHTFHIEAVAKLVRKRRH